jgi:Fe2+ or Zn2+ uptake regulation protein
MQKAEKGPAMTEQTIPALVIEAREAIEKLGRYAYPRHSTIDLLTRLCAALSAPAEGFPRAGTVLSAVIQYASKRDEFLVRSLVDDVRLTVSDALPKEVYNALGYLTRKGHLRRHEYGRYEVVNRNMAAPPNALSAEADAVLTLCAEAFNVPDECPPDCENPACKQIGCMVAKREMFRAAAPAEAAAPSALTAETKAGELSDDALLMLIHAHLPPSAEKALTRTTWKDGIDIDVPNSSAQAFANAIAKAAVAPTPSPDIAALRERATEVIARLDSVPHRLDQSNRCVVDIERLEADHDLAIRVIRDLAAALPSTDMEVQMIAWRSLAQEMTPGGSEFMTPDAVRAYYQDFKRRYHDAKCNEARLRKELAALSSPASLPDAETWLRGLQCPKCSCYGYEVGCGGDCEFRTKDWRAEYRASPAKGER